MTSSLVWLAAIASAALFTWALVISLGGRGKKKKHRRRVPPRKAVVEVAPQPRVEEPALPSFVDDRGGDPEVTVVTASPPVNEAEEPSASKVDVLYEDDATDEEHTGPRAMILVSASSQSDRGRVRKANEDSILVFPEHGVFAVADGMGGYHGGEVASAIAVETLRRAFREHVFDGKTESETPVPRRGLETARAIQMANQAILAKAQQTPELASMGTTLVTARFSSNKQRVYIGHVGDSRCYRRRGGALRQLTTDHTMGHLGMKGPGAEHLYQAVGVKPTISIDLIVDRPQPGDIYLLCSDGLSKMMTDAEINATLVQGQELEAAVNTLIESANAHGGRDNVSVILVQVNEVGTSPATLAAEPSDGA